MQLKICLCCSCGPRGQTAKSCQHAYREKACAIPFEQTVQHFLQEKRPKTTTEASSFNTHSVGPTRSTGPLRQRVANSLARAASSGGAGLQRCSNCDIYLYIYIYIRLVCVEQKINNVTVVVCTWNIRIQWDCAELFLWIKPLLPFGKHKLICLRVFALLNSHAYFSLSSAVAGSRLQVLQLSRLSLANFVECWFRCLFIGFGEMKT